MMKSQEETVHILDSLIEMTQIRDRGLMAKSLVKTLHELLEARKIEFYSISKAKEPVVLNLLARIDSAGLSSKLKRPGERLAEEVSRGIIRCINKRDIVVLDQPGSKNQQVIFPVLNEKGEIVSLLISLCDENNLEYRRLIRGILRLYQNYLSLLEESQRDRLTGLLNRETFINEINKLISSPGQEPSEILYPHSRRRVYHKKVYTYWLALVDIDHFKHVNDKYGHLYGDEVLIMLVRIMQSSFRKGDLLFRYGGEEFIVVLKVPSQEAAATAFERFRRAVAAYEFALVGHVTVSIGYVQITAEDFPLTAVGKADKALYFAKKTGRNRSVSFTQLVAQEEQSDGVEEEDGVEFF
jgi:two-component system, cell cycle response regulator